MSYVKDTLYTIKCDNCKSQFQGEEFGYWIEVDCAIEEAQEKGWTEHENNHYCPSCHKYNDDDELVLNLERSKF